MAAHLLARRALRCAAVLKLRSQEAGISELAAQRFIWAVSSAQLTHHFHTGLSRLQSAQPGQDSEEQRKAMVNRLLYRSRQRGFLELDLLVGMWAEEEVPRMDMDMIRDFEAVLGQENPDMFKWLTEQEAAPADMQANRAFRALQAHVRTMTDKKHSVPAAPEPKEWVRGWSDTGRDLSGGGAQSSSTGSSNQTG